MKTGVWRKATVALVCSLVALTGVATAQSLYVYPQKGQSADQQTRDRGECHGWAVQQTGFDPGAAPAPPPTASAPQGGAVRGAARGAAVGAVGGAIAGDAGTGAAVGAATGALFGTMRRRDQARQQEAQNQQYQAAASQRQAEYKRALSACLTARGYTVQ
jgi:Glycine-zipper domain